jgi:hypothetical protein
VRLVGVRIGGCHANRKFLQHCIQPGPGLDFAELRTCNDAEQIGGSITASLAAGGRTADLMTLVSSAIRNDLHVWAYIKGVLDALLAGCTDYHSLRPDVWATAHPEQIRTYRKDERRDRADRKIPDGAGVRLRSYRRVG